MPKYLPKYDDESAARRTLRDLASITLQYRMINAQGTWAAPRRQMEKHMVMIDSDYTNVSRSAR